MISFKDFVLNVVDDCFDSIECFYILEDVFKLCGFVVIQQILVECGVNKFWELFKMEDFVNVLGVLFGNQVM